MAEQNPHSLPNRQLSEKELEAAPALLMLLSRVDHATDPTAFSSTSTWSSSSSPPRPQPSAGHQVLSPSSRARVSISSLLNEDDAENEESSRRTSGPGRSQLAFSFGGDADADEDSNGQGFAALRTMATSSLPTSPISSPPPLLHAYSSSLLPPLSAVFSSSSSSLPTSPSPPPRSSSADDSVAKSRRTRSGRKQLSASSPDLHQKGPKEGRKRKSSKASGATTSPATSSKTKSDRKTKKQRQIELLQSVNCGHGSPGAMDVVADEKAQSAPSVRNSSRAKVENTSTPIGFSYTAEETDPATSGSNSGMPPPASIAAYLNSTSLPLSPTLQHLQQLLPSPLPANIDQQRVAQLTMQLQNISTSSGRNTNLNPHHVNRFGDKKRERRDSFSLTYPSRGEHHHTSAPAAPLPQHQQEFIQQLLQQIHHKKQGTEGPAREVKQEATPTPESISSPVLSQIYQRIPKLASQLPSTFTVPAPVLQSTTSTSASSAADESIADGSGMEISPSSQSLEEVAPAESSLMDEERAMPEPQQLGDSFVHGGVHDEADGQRLGEGEHGEMHVDSNTADGQANDSTLETNLHDGRTGSLENDSSESRNQEQSSQDSDLSYDDLPRSVSSDSVGVLSDDILAGRRKKASPQQMALLEQIWSSVGFRNAMSSSTSLNFTSSFPSLSSASRSLNSSPSMSRSRRSSASSIKSASSSPSPSIDIILPSSHRTSPSSTSSPGLSFTVSSPNLPSFFVSSFANLKKGAGTISDDVEGPVREVEAAVLESTPNLPSFDRSTISMPSRVASERAFHVQRSPAPSPGSSIGSEQATSTGQEAEQDRTSTAGEGSQNSDRRTDEAFGEAFRAGPEDGSVGAY